MSSKKHHNAQIVAVQDKVQSNAESWEQEIVPLLPKELEEYAWRLGVMQRKSGKIKRASDLLRGFLAYALCVSSLRGGGAWGVLAGMPDMANTSWREHLLKSGEWGKWRLNQHLQTAGYQPSPWLKKAGYSAIELVDATHLRMCWVRWKGLAHLLYVFAVKSTDTANRGEQYESGGRIEEFCHEGWSYLCG